MNRALLTISVLILISCQAEQQGDQNATDSPSILENFSSEFREIHKQGHINGFGVAIVNKDSVIYSDGIGYSNIDQKTEYTRNTLQNIGSVSKTFIGIALLKAQELGKLQLDDPINDYLPYKVINPSFPDEPITIRHLATHTSTILDTDYYDSKAYVLKESLKDSTVKNNISEYFNPPESNIPLVDFLEKLLSAEGEWYEPDGFLEKRPGEIYEYSNIGSALAGAVIEIAVGQPYNEFTTEHILEPLEMNSSGWTLDEVDLSKHSVLYSDPNSALPLYSLITYPDGGMITSPHDLGKYLSELIRGYAGGGTLLEKESYEELFREQLGAENFLDRDEEDDFDDEYNTGIFMGFSGTGYVGHTGGDPGIATFMFFHPSTLTGRIIMINTSVINAEGEQQFFSVWNRLWEYDKKNQ